MQVGGDRGWEGSMWLQPWHVEVMSSVMPGQNTEDSALTIMAEVPWWGVCNAIRQSCLRDGGMTMQSLYRMTPSIIERCSRNG